MKIRLENTYPIIKLLDSKSIEELVKFLDRERGDTNKSKKKKRQIYKTKGRKDRRYDTYKGFK